MNLAGLGWAVMGTMDELLFEAMSRGDVPSDAELLLDYGLVADRYSDGTVIMRALQS